MYASKKNIAQIQYINVSVIKTTWTVYSIMREQSMIKEKLSKLQV
jgi:hypothetical protein